MLSVSGTAAHRPLCPDGTGVLDRYSAAPCAERSRKWVLLATITASAMAFIEGSIVTIALPAMQAELDASFGAAQWIVNVYALMLGGLILIGGTLGDRFGRRRVFVGGIGLFALASVVCGAATDVAVLLAGRCVQGVGAALLVPQSLAIIAAAFPRETRGRAIGIWAGAAAMTTALGPALGGLLIDWLNWRSIFWLNLPFAALAAWASVVHVPESRDAAATGPLDWRGALLGVAAIGALTLALSLGAEGHLGLLPFMALSAAGLLLLGLFVRVERNAAAPVLPLELFHDRMFTNANLMTLFLYGALSAALFLLPFELIARRGQSATTVGLTLLPFGLIIGTLSRFAGDWADRVGPRRPLAGGAAIVAVSVALLALNATNYWLGVLAPVVLLAFGMALVVAPLTTAVMNAAPDSRSGAASGINNAASRLAALFAIAAVGAIASQVFVAVGGDAMGSVRFGTLPPPDDPVRTISEQAFVAAYRVAMSVAGTGALLAALIAWFGLAPGRAAEPQRQV